MTGSPITTTELLRALQLRDLSDPAQGPHAMQVLLAEIHQALAAHWGCPRQLHRSSPLVTLADNYDHLAYPDHGPARDRRYTRYLGEAHLLRTQASSAVPGLLRALALDPPEDLLLVLPGLVYRRDLVDRTHVGEPHQLDLWRITGKPLDSRDLGEMVSRVMAAALPAHHYRLVPSQHPYTTRGMQIDVLQDGQWLEVGECGLIAPTVLSRAGLDPSTLGGLAMGLGLDRLLMCRKGIDDIRLLRSTDPRVQAQMADLQPYRPVSTQPAITRDLSLAVDEALDDELLGDRIREALGAWAECLESLEILGETSHQALPLAARDRLGLREGQKNILLRLVLRHPVRSLHRAEADCLAHRVYRAVHQGRPVGGIAFSA